MGSLPRTSRFLTHPTFWVIGCVCWSGPLLTSLGGLGVGGGGVAAKTYHVNQEMAATTPGSLHRRTRGLCLTGGGGGTLPASERQISADT